MHAPSLPSTISRRPAPPKKRDNNQKSEQFGEAVKTLVGSELKESLKEEIGFYKQSLNEEIDKALELKDEKISQAKTFLAQQKEEIIHLAKQKAQAARDLTYQEADGLVAAASGNPIKSIAAKSGARQLKRKADKLYDVTLEKVINRADAKMTTDFLLRIDELEAEVNLQIQQLRNKYEGLADKLQ